MIRHVVASILLCFSLSAWADDYLDPEESLFSGDVNGFIDEYDFQVVTYFKSTFVDGVILKVIVLPSFEPEYVVGIKKLGDGYVVFYDRSEVQLATYEFEFKRKKSELEKIKTDDPEKHREKLSILMSQYPDNKFDAKHIVCEKPIDENLVKAIHFVWIEMLLRTQYSKDSNMGRDRTDYHFSGVNYLFEDEQDDLQVLMRFNGVYAGHVWSPEPKTKTGQLVEISKLMVDYCFKSDEDRIAKLLSKKVKKLKGRV